MRLTTQNLALDFDNDDDFALAQANWEAIERISRDYPLALNVNHVENAARRFLRDLYPQRD